MRVVRWQDIKEPFRGESGEVIYEMIGAPSPIGGTTHHNFVHVVIPPGKSSQAHYHRRAEETYYVLSGVGRMILDGREFNLTAGQACLIMPGQVHQIFNDQSFDLTFNAVSAPAWTPSDWFEAGAQEWKTVGKAEH